MNKKILVIFALLFVFIFINSVNANEDAIDVVNSTEEYSYSIDSDDTSDLLTYTDNSDKLEAAYNQSSTIIVSDDYDEDGEYWVDDSQSSLKIKIKVGNSYSTDGKVIIECNGNTKEYNYPTEVGYDTRLGHIYGFTVGLDDLTNVGIKSVKDVKITFIGNRYTVKNKSTGEILQLPKVKDSTINIKVRTGTKTITINNEYNTKFELSSYDYSCIKNDQIYDGLDIYYLKVCTGTVKKVYKTTWKKKSVFVFKVGKIIKVGKKKFKSIKLAKKYVQNTFKMAFKGGKYIKIYKKGNKYYQLWKVPVKHYKNVKIYKEVKGEINKYDDGIKLWYNFYNTKNQHVYQLDDLNHI